ncbi:MAG: tetratricopeptide repeat protein [Sphingomonas sp.]
MSEVNNETKFEIGHVLFIDIVGYSKLLIEEQKERLKQLTEIVLETAPVREATDEQLVRLPTGDGMALVFHHSAEEPARCALEIAEALRKHPELPVRMGIHSGPVSEVQDVSGRSNIAGAGINMAQRVMDCGDAGHILLSQHVADDLMGFRQWAPRLHDLGECEVKHGVRLHLVNLYADPLGNATLPKKFATAKSAQRRSKGGLIAALVLVALLAAGAAYYFTSHRTVASGAPMPEKSIAVLPLVNSTGDPANEYFSDGMSEEFISSLSRMPDLKVVGHTSSFQFKGKTDDSKTIGEKLGVYYLLEGSVRKSADRVRIAVALVKSSDGVNVWSETYDRQLKDIFAVQSEIAQSVAGELKVALLGADEKNPGAPSNQNVEAYTAYLQGRFHEQLYTAADLRTAIGFYDTATRSDPHYALAYAALSKSWYALGDITGEEVAEANRKARAAAERAVAEDPNSAAGHAALGQILVSVDRNEKGAEAEYRRALELAPASDEPKIGLATVIADFGQIEEAVELLQQAVRLEPLSTNAHFNLARLLTSLGRYDEAVRSARKAIQLQPGGAGTWQVLALVEAKSGDGEAALKAALQESDPDWRAYAIALAQQARGDTKAADEALNALIAGHSNDMSFQIATVYAFRGDADKAFEWLEQGYQKQDPGVMSIVENAFTRELRSDPRFTAFAQKIGVMPKAAAKP